jgi:hypothetical protein
MLRRGRSCRLRARAGLVAPLLWIRAGRGGCSDGGDISNEGVEVFAVEEEAIHVEEAGADAGEAGGLLAMVRIVKGWD